MRARKWRDRIWAAWVGLFALALNALVPVHLAFDLAEASEPAHQCRGFAEIDSVERHLLALLTGHREAGGAPNEHRDHHGNACPVCSALGALAGFVPPAPTALSVPLSAALPEALPLTATQPAGVPSGYRSRAPPLA
jgi:hypothetical protein